MADKLNADVFFCCLVRRGPGKVRRSNRSWTTFFRKVIFNKIIYIFVRSDKTLEVGKLACCDGHFWCPLLHIRFRTPVWLYNAITILPEYQTNGRGGTVLFFCLKGVYVERRGMRKTDKIWKGKLADYRGNSGMKSFNEHFRILAISFRWSRL